MEADEIAGMLTIAALPDYVRLKAEQESDHLARGRTHGRHHSGEGAERRHPIADQIECPLLLTVPWVPADVLHSIGEARAFLAVFVPVVWPGFDYLCDMLDGHRQVESVHHMESWTNTRRFSQRPRPLGAIAEDRQLGARCCATAMQHATRLVRRHLGLGWHTAEDDLLAVIIAAYATNTSKVRT